MTERDPTPAETAEAVRLRNRWLQTKDPADMQAWEDFEGDVELAAQRGDPCLVTRR